MHAGPVSQQPLQVPEAWSSGWLG